MTIIDNFYEYAGKDEECDTLKKSELKELLVTEFHQILKVRIRHKD